MLQWDCLFSGRLVCYVVVGLFRGRLVCHVIVGLFVQWSFSVSCYSGTVCTVVV